MTYRSCVTPRPAVRAPDSATDPGRRPVGHPPLALRVDSADPWNLTQKSAGGGAPNHHPTFFRKGRGQDSLFILENSTRRDDGWTTPLHPQAGGGGSGPTPTPTPYRSQPILPGPPTPLPLPSHTHLGTLPRTPNPKSPPRFLNFSRVHHFRHFPQYDGFSALFIDSGQDQRGRKSLQ